MNDDFVHMHDSEEARAVAWMVLVPARPYARFVSFDRGHAEAYAAKMHGTIHALAEIVCDASHNQRVPQASASR